jgi:hypothetical protein
MLDIITEGRIIKSRFGFYSALIAFIAASGYCAVQILQIAGIFSHPTDAALIYSFSLGIATPFMLALLALHYHVPQEKKIWTHAAILFALMYAIYVTLNYVVQLATVLPMEQRGKLADIRLLDQTPHSLFWDMDALGYIFLGFSTLFASFAFEKTGKDKWLKWFLIANALITPVIGLVYFYPEFSIRLLLLGSPWIITAPGSMLLLALYFSRSVAAIKDPYYINKPYNHFHDVAFHRS